MVRLRSSSLIEVNKPPISVGGFGVSVALRGYPEGWKPSGFQLLDK
jgi:hypothetical protein